MFSYPNVCRNVFLFQYFLDFISAVYIMPTEDCKILKFSFKQSVKKKKKRKKYIEPVNCSVTRLHCLLNIFSVCVRVRVCAYIQRCICTHRPGRVYRCVIVTYAIQLWDRSASENTSHNSFFRNSCQYLHSSISSQAYWVLLLVMY